MSDEIAECRLSISEYRSIGNMRLLTSVLRDAHFAIRMLHRTPGFSLAIILTLALGIACNGAIFAVVDAVLFRPLPFQERQRLIQMGETYKGSLDFGNVPLPTFLDWKQQSRSFESLGGSFRTEMSTQGGNEPTSLLARRISPDYFAVFKVTPASGRPLLPEDFSSSSRPVVILSHRFWSTGLGSRPNIIGQALLLDGTAHTVVGVMPSSFKDYSELEADLRFSAGAKVDLWVPLVPDRLPFSRELVTNRSEELLEVVGRLNHDSDLTQARTEMALIANRLSQQYPATNKDRGVIVKKLNDALRGDNWTPLFLLWTAVGFLLLIACANVANLLLSRSAARQKEIAIRIAVGATRWQIVRQLLLESILLALLGGIAGLVLVGQGVGLINTFRASSSLLIPEIQMDLRVLMFTLLTSLCTGVLFGLVPALRTSTVNLDQFLRAAEKGSTEGGHRNRLAGLLVIAEVSLALVLSVGAGLLVKSMIRLLQVNPGFVPDGVLTMVINLPNSRYPTGPEQIRFFQRTIERVSALAGVQAAAVSNLLPMFGANSTLSFAVESEPLSPQDRRSAEVHNVSGMYLGAMGVPLYQGRFFSERDTENGLPVVVVNQMLARQCFRGQSPMYRPRGS
jgi:putative ABC transport system permease protein